MFEKNARRGGAENPIFTYFLVLNGLILFGLGLWGSHSDGLSLVESFLASLLAVIFAFGIAVVASKGHHTPFVMILLVINFAAAGITYEHSKRGEVKQQNKNDMTIFAEEKAPVLHDSLKKTQQIQSEVLEKKQKLKQVLISLNRSADQDEDVKRYDSLLSDLKVTEKKLKVNLEDAFIAYKKYEISSDPAYERELSRLSSSSQLAAEEIQNKYKDLRKKMSASMQ